MAQNMEEMFRKKAEATRVSLPLFKGRFNFERKIRSLHGFSSISIVNVKHATLQNNNTKPKIAFTVYSYDTSTKKQRILKNGLIQILHLLSWMQPQRYLLLTYKTHLD